MNLNYAELTEKYKSLMTEEFESNTGKYMDNEGNIENEYILEETAMKSLIKELNYKWGREGLKVEDKMIYQIEDKIKDGVGNGFFSDLEEDVKDAYQEYSAYNRDPYAYNGVSRSDFI